MYTLEYIKSRGKISEHMHHNVYHKDVVDYYLLLKDNKRIFSEKQDWSDYCLALEIDNLNGEILIKKIVYCIASNPIESCYSTKISDYQNIKDDLFAYIEEVKDVLDILNYKIRV